MRRDLFSIGDFSRMCRLTVKALRLYDEQDILKPGFIDSQSGYRYYSSAQLGEADLIRELRSLELPLDDVRKFLGERDAAGRRSVLEKHRAAMEARLQAYGAIVSRIERLTEREEEKMDNDVEMKELADQTVVSTRFKTSIPTIGEDLGKAYMAVFGMLGKMGVAPVGPPFAVYHDLEFKEDDIDVEAGVPVAGAVEGGDDVKGGTLKGGTFASTLHAGAYDEVGKAYEALMLWVSENGYRPGGPCREIYLVGPEQADDPDRYRTEIVCPIEKAE